MNYKKQNVLIVGGGMYVSGRGTKNYGTVLPAIFEAKKCGYINKVFIATTNPDSSSYVKKVIKKLSKIMKVYIDFDVFPKKNIDKNAYLKVIKKFSINSSIVAVPDHLHFDICNKIINQKTHCMVVKPMTSNLKEAKLLTSLAINKKVIGQVEFHKRLDISNQILKDKISSGELGKLQYASIEYSQQKKIPTKIFKKWVRKTNIFQYLGVHYVDLLYYITNFKPVSVVAWGQKDFLISKGIDTWDSIQVIVKWKRNDNKTFISSHLSNWIDPDKTTALSDQKISIVGTKARYSSDQKNRGIEFVSDKDGSNHINPYFTFQTFDKQTKSIVFSGYGIDNIKQFFKDIDLFNNNKISLNQINKTRPSFKESIISSAVIEAAYKSLTNNNKIIKIKL